MANVDYNMTTAQLKLADQPKSLKMAVVQVFRDPGKESAQDMMKQIKELSTKDLEWFAKMFKDEVGWEFAASVGA